jgi:HAD superfamily hydrolase (TIGR01490 family)
METTSSRDRNPLCNHIAFFDLDKTITKSISGKDLVRGAYSRGLLTRSDLIKAVFLSVVFRLKLQDPLKIIDNMVSWAEGIPEMTMVNLCTEVFRQVLVPAVYRKARFEIETHKAKNARVIILSSTLTTVCQEMAKYLGMDDIICTELEVRNGYLTGRPVGHLCFGEEKAQRLKEYCERNNFSTSNAWYYADSFSDLPALNSVGNPVCVNPDQKLKRTAVRRGWKIVSWNT